MIIFDKLTLYSGNASASITAGDNEQILVPSISVATATITSCLSLSNAAAITLPPNSIAATAINWSESPSAFTFGSVIVNNQATIAQLDATQAIIGTLNLTNPITLPSGSSIAGSPAAILNDPTIYEEVVVEFFTRPGGITGAQDALYVCNGTTTTIAGTVKVETSGSGSGVTQTIEFSVNPLKTEFYTGDWTNNDDLTISEVNINNRNWKDSVPDGYEVESWKKGNGTCQILWISPYTDARIHNHEIYAWYKTESTSYQQAPYAQLSNANYCYYIGPCLTVAPPAVQEAIEKRPVGQAFAKSHGFEQIFIAKNN